MKDKLSIIELQSQPLKGFRRALEAWKGLRVGLKELDKKRARDSSSTAAPGYKRLPKKRHQEQCKSPESKRRKRADTPRAHETSKDCEGGGVAHGPGQDITCSFTASLFVALG